MTVCVKKQHTHAICRCSKLYKPQLSINGVGLTKPQATSLSPTSKHSSHLRKPSKGGR